jgi:hypothetical protein
MTVQEKITKLEQELSALKKELAESQELWKPEYDDKYFFVSNLGTVERNNLDDFRWNVILRTDFFPTSEQAEKASKYMRQSNMVIKACLQVDPYFEPDWRDESQDKWTMFYNHESNRWELSRANITQIAPCFVSSSKKAQQVCDLLNKEKMEE